MSADDTERDAFESLGWYSPGDARRFLEALGNAGIEYRSEIVGGPINILLDADRGLIISVEAARREEAHQLHTKLFGDALPNFASTYFREHPPAPNPNERQ